MEIINVTFSINALDVFENWEFDHEVIEAISYMAEIGDLGEISDAVAFAIDSGNFNPYISYEKANLVVDSITESYPDAEIYYTIPVAFDVDALMTDFG